MSTATLSTNPGVRIADPSNRGVAPDRSPHGVIDSESEHSLALPDGLRLFYRAFLPATGFDRALIVLHRGHEHSGRLIDVVRAFELEQTAVFAWDARGHGRSGGPRGHAPSFQQLVRDLDCFVRKVTSEHDVSLERTAVLGHSVGGVIAATWVHDFAPPIEKLVLVTPAFRVRLYLPFALPLLRLWQRLKGRRPGVVKSYVKSRLLTHDRHEAARYDADPLITRDIGVPVLIGLRAAADRVIEDAGAIKVPTLVLSGGADWVVDHRAQRRFSARLGSAVKRQRTFAGMFHDLLHERGREPVIDAIREFLIDHQPEDGVSEALLRSLLEADEAGHTREEYDRFQRPLRLSSLRGIGYRALRFGLATLGRLSSGIALGWRTGFDSGLSLDYVYRNRSSGRLGIGRLFDRWYLDSPGWRGIRQRRIHLRSVLKRAVDAQIASGEPAHAIDLACGGGRYVIDVMGEYTSHQAQAVLRDHDARNLRAAKALATRRGLRNVRVEVGDAFDRRDLEAISPQPNIVIVSGLYELFPSNRNVRTSLKAIAERMIPGGYLIYTNQPWHPQIELIARTLDNRQGQPWIMRRRTQAEMDALVAAAGFRKCGMLIDDDGIFTVSWARSDPSSDQGSSAEH